jgi:hypothetical protein
MIGVDMIEKLDEQVWTLEKKCKDQKAMTSIAATCEKR